MAQHFGEIAAKLQKHERRGEVVLGRDLDARNEKASQPNDQNWERWGNGE